MDIDRTLEFACALRMLHKRRVPWRPVGSGLQSDLGKWDQRGRVINKGKLNNNKFLASLTNPESQNAPSPVKRSFKALK